MKKLLLFCLFFSFPCFSQTQRTWIQTSVADFSTNTFDNAVVTDRAGGEVRLQYPLVKTRGDTLDNNILRYLSFDRRGNAIRTWSRNDTVFAQRYDSLGAPVSPPLLVNESGKGAAQTFNGVINGALMDNGYFYVIWYSRDSARVYGQLYDNANQKVGGHVLFDPFYSNTWKGNPSVFADNSDSTFGVIESYRTARGVDSIRIYFTRVDLQGTKLGELRRLPAQVSRSFANWAFAAIAPNFEFIVAWVEDNDIVSGGNYMYIQRFARDGTPVSSAILVTDVNGQYMYHQRLAFDPAGHLLVCWGDNRNAGGRQGYYDAYAQFFDIDMRRIGCNFIVNTTPPGAQYAVWHPELRFQFNRFTITWEKYNEPIRLYEKFYDEWSLNSRLNGTSFSSVSDAGPLIQNYQTISWNDSSSAGTSLRFQLRSAASRTALDTATWFGPTSATDFYSTSGASINPRHNSHRFMQYKAFFSTSIWGDSPELRDFSIAYQITNVTPPLPPTNLAASTATSLVRLTWQASSSARLMRYKIYRGMQPNVYDSLWTKSVLPSQLSYSDSSVRNGRTYYYAVSALDSNLLESARSNEIVATPLGIVLYVRAGAPPGGNGTPQNPFARINDAMPVATWGDTILALPGVYSEFIPLKKGIRLLGSGPRVTRLQSSPTGDTSAVIWGADSCLVKGFTIAVTRGAATWDDAIVAYPGSFAVTDNVILNEATLNSGEGCYARSGDVTFLRNYVVGFRSGFNNFDSSASRIENNIFVTYIGVSANAIGRAPRIINNTIISSFRGISFGFSFGLSSNVRNNLLVGAGSGITYGIYVSYDQLTADYNNMWRFTYAYGGNGIFNGTGNTFADPLFVSEPRADYRLRSGSPCRDVGDPSPEFNDLDGSRNDMGAFGGPNPIDPTIFPSLPVIFGTGNGSGFPGDTVSIGVSLSNAAAFSRGNFTISYSSQVVDLVSFARTSLTQNFQLTVDTSIAGRATANLFSSGEIGSGSGDILQLRFKISPNATINQSSPLTLSSVSLRDSLNQSLIVQEIRNGTIVLNPGSGAGRYVYVNGNNAGAEDGTRYRPYRRIQSAINVARAGDTVIVASGYYQQLITMRDSIHLKGSGSLVTTIRCDSSYPPQPLNPTLKLLRVKGCSISGFTILSPPSNLASTIICDSSSATFHHNQIAHIGSSSIGTLMDVMNGSRVTLTDNYFNALSRIDEFVFVYRSFADMRRNTFGSSIGEGSIAFSNQSRGIVGNNRMNFSRSLWAGINIENSNGVLIHNNVITSGQSSASSIGIRTSDSVVIINNTMDTRFRGIDNTSLSTRIVNNIITGNASYGVNAGIAGALRYNDVWGNTTNYVNTAPGYGDISQDPLFVERLRQNYHLQPTSPCRNAGDSSTIYNDLDGSRNDMGMYGGPLLDTTMFPQHGATMRIASPSVAAGDSFALPITAQLIRELATVSLQLMFDETKLRCVGARTTASTATLSLSFASVSGGVARVALFGTHGVDLDSTAFIELLFVARASIGATAVSFQQVDCYSPTASTIPIERLVNGTVNVGPTDVRNGENIPHRFALQQNYPNPFNPTTTIRYEIPSSGRVVLELFNILGQKIASLVNEEQLAGSHDVRWNGKTDDGFSVASGIYFYRLQFGSSVDAKKLVLLR